jgi:K+-transporting ATPase KdpF subunit
MNPMLDQVVALVVTFGLLGYLVYVLLKPERF